MKEYINYEYSGEVYEEVLEMMESDLNFMTNPDTKEYVKNVIEEIEDSLK